MCGVIQISSFLSNFFFFFFEIYIYNNLRLDFLRLVTHDTCGYKARQDRNGNKFHDFRLFKAATLFVLHLVLVPFRHGLKSLKFPEYRLVVCIV